MLLALKIDPGRASRQVGYHRTVGAIPTVPDAFWARDMKAL